MAFADALGLDGAGPEAAPVQVRGQWLANDQRRELLLRGLGGGVDDVAGCHRRESLQASRSSDLGHVIFRYSGHR